MSKYYLASSILRGRIGTKSRSISAHAQRSYHRSLFFLTTRSNSSSSAAAHAKKMDPGKLVAGLTSEDIKSNPEIEDFVRSNFQDGNDAINDEVVSGIVIPDALLKEFGYEENNSGVDTTDGNNNNKYNNTPRIDAGLGDAEQQKLNIRVMKTYLRTEEGTRSCDHLRYNDSMIPGILFGGDPSLNILSSETSSNLLVKTSWAEIQRELDRYHRRFESRVYDITVYENEDDLEGTVHRVVPSSVQRHPVQGKIYCTNFLRYHPKRKLKLPLTYINQEESPALKRDGFIIPVRKYVECFVDQGVPIPDAVEVECTGLLVKDVIKIDRLIFPDGVKPIDRLNLKDFVVGPVRGGRSAATAETEGDDPESENE